MKKFFLIIAAVLGFMSCSSDDNFIEQGSPGLSESENPLGLSERNIKFNFADSCKSVSVKSTGWHIDEVHLNNREFPAYQRPDASSEAEGATIGKYEWITVKTESNKIMLSPDYNNSMGIRTFSLFLRKGDIVQELFVVQYDDRIGDSSDHIRLSPREMDFDAAGGTKKARFNEPNNYVRIERFTIDNTLFELSRSETYAFAHEKNFEKTFAWLTIKRSGDDIFITVAPNETQQVRTLELRFISFNFSTGLKLTQAGK